jgi:hypothetical protein
MATIWDADVLTAASRTVDARDRGLRTSRLMGATPHDILAFIRSREGRPINDSSSTNSDGRQPGACPPFPIRGTR